MLIGLCSARQLTLGCTDHAALAVRAARQYCAACRHPPGLTKATPSLLLNTGPCGSGCTSRAVLGLHAEEVKAGCRHWWAACLKRTFEISDISASSSFSACLSPSSSVAILARAVQAMRPGLGGRVSVSTLTQSSHHSRLFHTRAPARTRRPTPAQRLRVTQCSKGGRPTGTRAGGDA